MRILSALSLPLIVDVCSGWLVNVTSKSLLKPNIVPSHITTSGQGWHNGHWKLSNQSISSSCAKAFQVCRRRFILTGFVLLCIARVLSQKCRYEGVSALNHVVQILKEETILEEVSVVYVEKEILLSIIEKLTTTFSLGRPVVDCPMFVNNCHRFLVQYCNFAWNPIVTNRITSVPIVAMLAQTLITGWTEMGIFFCRSHKGCGKTLDWQEVDMVSSYM